MNLSKIPGSQNNSKFVFFSPSLNKRIAEVSEYRISFKFKDNGGRFNIEVKKLFKTKLSI